LRTAIPLGASAENLQEYFSSRLNKDPSTNGLAGGRRRARLPVAIVGGFGVADVRVLVFDIVAGRQDLQQIAAGDLLPGGPAVRAASPGVISPHART
jgi:hypothetical protein